MANGKDPAVLFYTSDFLSGCALMDMRERGQYITLLCLQRERGHMTMQEIEKAVKKPSPEVMGKFRKDEEGKYYNARMELEIEKRDAHCRKQQERANKRWGDEKGNSGICRGIAPAIPLGNGNNKSSGKSKKEWIPPTLEEVEQYAKERGVPDLAARFYEYFSVGKWVDSEGKPVRSWKQKFLTWESKAKERGSTRGTNGNAGGTPAKTRDWNLDAIVL